MSSQKPKKVHYEPRSSKSSSKHASSKHDRHNSKDSGIGSSTASDRASLGTSPAHEYPYESHQTFEEQRYNLRVVQEALDAAYEEIKDLKASVASLNESLSESHRENRALRKDKKGLLEERQDLLAANEEMNKRLKREKTPPKPERRPSIRKSEDSSPRHSTSKVHAEEMSPRHSNSKIYVEEANTARPRSNHSDREFRERERRASMAYSRPPQAPEPPYNSHPNPFAPQTPAVSYASIPTSVSYASSSASYSAHPLYVTSGSVSGSKRRSKEFDDGKYHLTPL